MAPVPFKGKKSHQEEDKPFDLLADVAKFASSLGLAAGGGGDFDDFAPQKAKQSIAGKRKMPDADLKPAAAKQDAASAKPLSAKAAPKQKDGSQGHLQSKSHVDPSIKTREWNVGCPRPLPGEHFD